MLDHACNRCRGLPDFLREPRAALLYTTAATAVPKLWQDVAESEATFTEPLPNAYLLGGDVAGIRDAVTRWRDRLSSVELAEVRGVFFEEESPTLETLAKGMLHLVDLDGLLAQLDGRWLLEVLRGDALFSHYQPLLSVAEGRVVAYESLIRARDGVGVVTAGSLIGAAGTMGLIHMFDQLARRSAVVNGHALVHAGYDLFINFSPSAIYDPQNCLRNTMLVCNQLNVPMEQLVFEVIEAEKVTDLGHLRRIVNEYRARGAKIALDDLGSGYSSILHLAELRPDYVKLDQGLVRGAHTDRVRGILLRAITEAAHDIGVTVVAEGIETADEMAFCIDIGADLLQGYFIARPAENPPPASTASLAMLGQLLPAAG